MKNPLITVIIPNYNHAKYLDERIQSVLNQTYQNFEVIILDDKSTDNSLEVINKYRDNPHVSQIVVNEENSGSTFKQWHKGFELAKGELIWIAESDDKCEKEFLETLLHFFEQEPQCVLAYTRSILFRDSDGELLNQHVNKDAELMPGASFIAEKMACGNSIQNASSVLFKKSVALNIDNQYTEYKGAGDRLFWIEIAEQGYVGIDYHQLNYFRIHENNSTKRYFYEGINQEEDLRILNYIYTKGYILKKQYKWAKRRYAQWVIFSDRLSREKKKEIINLWGLGMSDRLFLIYYNLLEIVAYKCERIKLKIQR